MNAPLLRRTALGKTAALVGVLAAACGSTGEQGSTSGASPQVGAKGFAFKQPVAVQYWKSLEGPRHEAQVKLTDDFNSSRSDINVSLEHVGGYAQAAEKLTAALAANTPPDVMLLTVDQHMPAFARQGALFPLDEYARADKSARMDTYAPGFIKNGTIKGKLYQIPFARSTPLLYFNKDHFVAAGLPDKAPATYDALLDTAQKLTRAGVAQPDSADGSKRALPSIVSWWPFQSTIWAFGGRYSDENFTPTATQRETVQAMEYLADAVYRHRAARAYKTGGAAQKAFIEGQLSFLFASTANLTQIEKDASFRVGAAFMPAQKQRAVPGGGSGLCIIGSAPQEKKEASWEYMKFMTTTPNTIYFSQQTGYMVVRTDAPTLPEYKRHLEENPNARVTFDQMQYVRTQDPIVGVPQVTPTIHKAMTEVLIEQALPRSAFEELQRQLAVLVESAPK
ncbi:MAG TPA: ABC transporter substrate-binding protein [Chloroflexota bacterium]|nr:ABC transporter substrate-binding protein [Chloroflexota bacterium]